MRAARRHLTQVCGCDPLVLDVSGQSDSARHPKTRRPRRRQSVRRGLRWSLANRSVPRTKKEKRACTHTGSTRESDTTTNDNQTARTRLFPIRGAFGDPLVRLRRPRLQSATRLLDCEASSSLPRPGAREVPQRRLCNRRQRPTETH